MMSATRSAGEEIRLQWQSPGDIFSLLLLVGADVVQKAIAQLVGVRFKLLSKGPTIYVTPIVFSFGWVAYAFTTLAAVLGDGRLMPMPDAAIQVVNCDNSYVRQNNAWILGRLLRDHEYRLEDARRIKNPPSDSTGDVALLIDIFVAKSVTNRGPRPPATWWLSWIFIVAQSVLAAIPWFLYGYWSPLMITISGTFLAMWTAAQPQWVSEKWPAAKLRGTKTKPVALTRGNGHSYVMVVLSHDGSWDLESMASNRSHTHAFTKYNLILTAILWVLLLLTVLGMEQHTWYLIAAGASGSVWQTYIAAKSFRTETFDMNLEPWHERASITGYQYTSARKDNLKENDWASYTEDDAEREYTKPVKEPDVRDVMGALIELEKCIPKAGAALLPTFFPGGLDYEPKSLGSEREKKFWAYAKGKRPALSATWASTK
jgi:hypothetical protein